MLKVFWSGFGEWDELKQQVDEAHQLVLKEYRVEDIYKAIDNRGKELDLWEDFIPDYRK